MINSNNLRISLDRREPGSDIDFVSHAHSDHLGAVRSSKMVLASPQTIQLIEHTQNITIQNKTDNCDLRLIEAGHMLGSRQLFINDDISGKRITYTGDFQTARSKTSNPIDVIETDVLIMDSTYEDPSVRFGDKEEIESSIQDWTSRKLGHGIVIFSAYAMGKAQELISIFNDIGIKPVVSKRIGTAANVYLNNGVKLDYCSAYDNESDYGTIIKDNFVGITDARDLRILKECLKTAHKKNVFTAVATGFSKMFRFNTDAQFPLSDHADFGQSVDYIEATGAKKILTYGPNAAAFARSLGNEGYVSAPFSDSGLSFSPKI